MNPTKLNISTLQYSSPTVESQLIFKNDTYDQLKSTTNSFLKNHTELIITNRRHTSSQGKNYFILKISKEKITYINSISIKMSTYELSLIDNTLLYNQNKLSKSALPQLLNYISKILELKNQENYELLLDGVPIK